MPLLYIFAMWFSQREYLIKENVILVIVLNKVQKQRWPLMAMFEHSFYLGAFHLVRTHLGGGVKPPIHFHCVLHAKRGWVGPVSM